MTPIFVFGSNLAGRHGKGAAKFALEHHGAIYGQGEGLQGSSYALPTKDEHLKVRTLNEIEESIRLFIIFAVKNPDLLFMVTPIGTGLAGYSKWSIANIFNSFDIPTNVVFTREWFTDDWWNL